MATKLKVNYEFVGDSTTPVTRTESIKHGDSMLNTVINAAAATVNTKADKSYVDTELAKKANVNDMEQALGNKANVSELEAVSDRVSANTTNIATQTARIDEIASLPEGSTSGDAELIDIRVGADGKTYTSAGAAVRGQISDVKGDVSDLEITFEKIENITEMSSYNGSSLTTTSGSAQSTGATYLVRKNVIKGGTIAKCTALKKDSGNVVWHIFEETQSSGWTYLSSQTGNTVFFDLSNYPESKNYAVAFTGPVNYTLTENITPMYQITSDNFVVDQNYIFSEVIDTCGFYVVVKSYKKTDALANEVDEIHSELNKVSNDVETLENVCYDHKYDGSNLTSKAGTSDNTKTYLLKNKVLGGGSNVVCTALGGVNLENIKWHLFEESSSGYIYVESKTGSSAIFKIPTSNKNYSIGFTGDIDYTLSEGIAPLYENSNTNFVKNNSYQFPAVINSCGFYADIKCYDKSTSKNPYYILVSKHGKGDFSTINQALSYAYTIESETNPVTIIVDSGTYNEVLVVGAMHNVSIIGVNRNDCIIRDDTGIYDNCPLRISGNAYVANLSLISTHNSNPEFVIDGVIQNALSYGLHIDDRHKDDNRKYKLTVENCYIYSEQNPAVGIGLDKNQLIEIINCECVSNIAEDVKNATGCVDGYSWSWKPNGGAFFYHALYSGSYTSSDGEQKLRVKDCIIKNNKSNIGFGEAGGLEQNVVLEFINNVGYSDVNGFAFVKGLNAASISPMSFGNNFTVMNYSL